MMVEFRRIQMLFLILVLQFSAVTGQTTPYITVRDGDEVTLSCENVMTDQDKCNSTTWIFSGSGSTSEELITFGQIDEEAKAKSDRLSVTANCSLVIKKVTVEDVGLYTCRQFRSGQQQGRDSNVDLSVVTMTEHKDADKVTLSCSVSTYEQCRHTVKWVFKDKDVDKDNKELKTSKSTCSASVSFLTSHFIYTSNYTYLKCNITDLNSGKVQQYSFNHQLSGDEPGEEGKTATTKPTTITTSENITDLTTTASDTKNDLRLQGCSALSYIMLVMRVAELLLITVVTVLLFRARGNQRPPDDNIVLNSVRKRRVKRSGPAASQQHNDEDDGEVNYENFGEPSASVRPH